MHDPSPKVGDAAPGFLSSDDSQTALPLSGLTCLLITPGSPSLSVATVAADDVDEVNLARTRGLRQSVLSGVSALSLANAAG